MSLAVLSDLCQPHDVARRVSLSQTVARSMSAACCCSQSASQPNRCPIYVSRMVSLAECVSAKPWPDPCQPHAVARRVHPAKSVPDPRQPHVVARRVHPAKSAPDPRQPHVVARRVHPAKSVPDLCQPHVVARRVRLSQTVVRSTSAA